MSSITLLELMQQCIIYDKLSGTYPESRYEGRSVFKDILENLFENKKITEIELNGLLCKLDQDEFYIENKLDLGYD